MKSKFDAIENVGKSCTMKQLVARFRIVKEILKFLLVVG